MRSSPKPCQFLPVAIAIAFALSAVPSSAQSPVAAPDLSQKIDTVFERWTQPGSPGCAVGLSGQGLPSVTKAYGLANLEFNVPITPDSIFESGSVAKQFTAAAIGLLVLDGKLAVTDPVAKVRARAAVLRLRCDRPTPAHPHRRSQRAVAAPVDGRAAADRGRAYD